MNRPHRVTFLALLLGAFFAAQTAHAGLEAAEGVMKLVPADLPMAGVIADFDKLDKTIKMWGKRIAPDQPESSPLDDIRGDLDIAEWIDFTKPVAIASVEVDADDPAIWASVPGFAEKVAKHEGAKKVEDHWEIPVKGEEGKNLFVKELDGGYVVAAGSAEQLAKATAKGAASLADVLKPRADILKDRDIVFHLEMKHFRDQAVGGLTAMGPMVGMIAMGMGQGGDPAAAMNVQAMLTAVLDSSKRFVEQLAYLDIVAGMDAQEANITLATGYIDGPIKSYLASAQPGGAALLTTIEDQPYLVAMGVHMPGGMGPLVEYFGKRMEESIKALPAPTPAEGQPPAKPGESPMVESMKLSIEMSGMLQAMNMVMSVQKDGMKMVGDAQVREPARYADMMKRSLASSNAMMQAFGGGMTYQNLGATKVGDVDVEQYALKLDNDPAKAMGAPDMTALYGANTRYAFGLVGDHMRFCMGAEADMQKAFARTVTTPFAANKYAEAAMKKLPAKRNGVMLMDFAGVTAVMEMFGQKLSGPLPPGAPFAMSFTLSGEPARVDIHIPLKAIERAVQAFSPQQPM